VLIERIAGIGSGRQWTRGTFGLSVPASGESLSKRACILFFVAAAVIRVAYVLVFMRDYHMQSDAQHYHDIAINVAHGHGIAADFPYGFRHPTAFRPPLFPVLLGGAYAVFGDHIATAQALNIVIGSVVVVVVGVITSRLGGRRAAWVAATLAAVYPPLLANDAVPLSEATGLLTLLLGIWALLANRLCWAGVAFGLLVLTRPSAQLLVPVLALVLWRQIGVRRAAAFLAVAVVVVTPWVIRNETIYHQPVIVTSNGFNLAAIYSPPALQTGRFDDPIFDPRFAPVLNYAHSLANLNEAALDNTLRDEGLQGIRDHPGRVPGIIALNMRELVDETWRLNAAAERSDGRPLGLRHLTLPLVWIVELTGLYGLIQLARQARQQHQAARRTPSPTSERHLGGGILPLIAAYFFLASVATVAVPRLRTPIDELMIIAIGLLASTRAARRDNPSA
jgi:4-amino-4-deoxy-L-arabinose transferase-like glycosyltransferase